MQKIILSARASNPYSFNIVGERRESFEVACICLKCNLLTERLNTFSQTRLLLQSPPVSFILCPLYQMPHSSCLFCVCWMGTKTWNINVLQSRAAFLFWSGLCATFPTTCPWFVTLQQVSSGQTSGGKFCVSKQLHKPATFLHTNEGFPYANRGAGSYLISCKGLVFRLNTSSAACWAHKILAIWSEQLCGFRVKPGNVPPLYLPGLVSFLISQTEACKGSPLRPGEMQRSPHSCNHQCDRWYGHFPISKCTFWFNWGMPAPPPPQKVPALHMFKYVHTLISRMFWGFFCCNNIVRLFWPAAGDCARSVMLQGDVKDVMPSLVLPSVLQRFQIPGHSTGHSSHPLTIKASLCSPRPQQRFHSSPPRQES